MDIQISEKPLDVGKKVVGTYITKDMYEKLKQEASDNFMSISDLIRKLIYLHVKESDKNC